MVSSFHMKIHVQTLQRNVGIRYGICYWMVSRCLKSNRLGLGHETLVCAVCLPICFHWMVCRSSYMRFDFLPAELYCVFLCQEQIDAAAG